MLLKACFLLPGSFEGNSDSFASLAPHFAQNTFHSRMSDMTCNLAPVWTCGRFVSIIHTAPWLIAYIACHVGCWKVFFLTDLFSFPVR